jgi:integrase/recombinase XerD
MERFVKGPAGAPVTLVEGTTIDKLLDDFSFYLQQERVLAPTTVANYVSLIKKFLTHRFGTGPADLSDLTAAQVVGSVQRLVPSLCRKRAKVMTSALRSFLRYARYQDFIRSDLAACVPCVADWSVASIPAGTSWAPSRRSCGPHIGELRLGSRAAHLARQR